MKFINIYIMILVLFSLFYIYLLNVLSIQVCFTCIIHELGALRVALKIQVMGFLED